MFKHRQKTYKAFITKSIKSPEPEKQKPKFFQK